jgi:uracil phosphoribosyltransferase
MYRDKDTKNPVAYYQRLPVESKNALYLVIDPMIATGGSTAAAIDLIKKNGATHIVVVCIVTCPEGLRKIENAHPDVRIYTAAIDDHLDERKYIVPGLGDAGDRLFGTS